MGSPAGISVVAGLAGMIIGDLVYQATNNMIVAVLTGILALIACAIYLVVRKPRKVIEGV